jgi:hypothetical protein
VADWRRLLPCIWSLGLALLVLGPALAPGYILSYDMVWVPDLALRPDFLGVGSGLPRAVPSDAVVAVLDEIVPGMLLQKLVLVAALVAGGLGARRLTDPRSLGAQLVAITLYQWNPFVAERLLVGHWPVLVGYAVLPWVILAAQRWRTTGELPPRLWCLVPLGCLSAGAGLVTAVVLLAFAVERSGRRLAMVAMLVVAGNAPWLVSGVLHASEAVTDPAGASAFALHAEGSVPAPLAALGLGGIWNSEVVPPSRTGTAGWLSVALLVVLVGIGLRRWVRYAGRREVAAFTTCWVLGWGIAVLTWAAPDQMAWVVAHVPGSGVLRDGARLLALCAPLLVAAAGHGAATVLGGVARAARPATAVVLLLAPVAVMPDAAFGVAGRLTPTELPADYALAREAMARDLSSGSRGDVLLLPLTSYRQPAWNHGHKVLDPVGRFLAPDFVAGDDLFVSGRRIAGEDPRARAAAAILERPTPEERSAGLAGLGVGYVVTERGPGPVPAVTGTVVHDGPELVVRSLEDPVARPTPWSWRIAMSVAWFLFLGLFFVGLGSRKRRAVRGCRLDT